MMKHKKKMLGLQLFMFMGILVMLYYGFSTADSGLSREDAQRAKEAIQKAALECYSIEGAYPQSLEYLKQHAVRMAVASSAPMELIKSNLRLAGIADYFDAVVSGEQVEHGKPFPDIFLLAAQKLNLQAQDCYVFEDGINGVRAGIQAGCSTIMVPDLVPPTKELYEQCTGIYPSLHAVLHALQTYTC